MQTLRTAIGLPGAMPKPAQTSTYIRSAQFDSALLLVPLAAGLAVGAITVTDPRLFRVLLFMDVWLLGYHHVVATYTRLAFDRQSLRTNRFLAVDLLLLVMAGVVLLTLVGGAWLVASAFLYLQWFHYMRQGYGLSRMYFRATSRGQGGQARDAITDAVIYAVPIYGIAHRSSTMGDSFLGSTVVRIVPPEAVVMMIGAVAAVAVMAWMLRTAGDWWRGRLDQAYAGFVASHVLIFLIGYVLIDEVNIGWLTVNVWHNLQYVLVVWMVNSKRYSGGVDPSARLLSTLSQPGRVWWYFGTCVAISTLVYFNLDQLTRVVLGGSLAATLGVYMGINFHHYVVDALIWKRRRVAPAGA